MTGFLVKLLMESHNMTPALLAARANLPLAAVEKIVAGSKPNITTREITRLAQALNVKAEALEVRPAPGLESRPAWRILQEEMFQAGNRYGWENVDKFLVVVNHTWGREVAHHRAAEAHARAILARKAAS
jgi:hypothetical protein